jgi:hypothetical protein
MIRLKWILIAGLILGAAGLALFLGFTHHHHVCIAPYASSIPVGSTPPSRGNCTLVGFLYFLGIGMTVLGVILVMVSAVANLRDR